MKGARINFGVPNSEYVLLANDNGEATSLKNQDTGTEYIGGGGGGSDTVIVTETNGTLDITPNQLKAALAEGKRIVMYFEDVEEGIYKQDFISSIIQNADNEINTFSYTIAFYEGGVQIEAVKYYSSDGGDNPFVAN